MGKYFIRISTLLTRHGILFVIIMNIIMLMLHVFKTNNDMKEMVYKHHKMVQKKQDIILDTLYKLDENVVKGVKLTDRAEVNNISQISKLHGDLDKLFQVTTTSTDKNEKLDKLEKLLKALQSDVHALKSKNLNRTEQDISNEFPISKKGYRIERLLSTGAVIRTPGNSFFIAKPGGKTPLGVVTKISKNKVVIGKRIITK